MKAVALCALFATVAACASQPPSAPPKLTSASTSETVAVPWPDLGRGEPMFIRIDLGPDVFAECRRISPKFPFDSASTYAQDEAQLAAFAACLNAPGQRERSVQLIGRADPRGSSGYNDELGMKRASTIKRLLIEHGIAEGRIEVVSEGAKGAVGDKPDYSYGYDRRVDVVVKGGSHLP